MSKEPQWSTSFRYLVGILLFVAFVLFAVFARDALRNLVIAAFIAYLLNPAVDYLSKRLIMTRRAAVNYVYFIALIVFVGLPVALAPVFSDEFKFVFEDIVDLTNQLSTKLLQPVRIFGLEFRLDTWGQQLKFGEGSVVPPEPQLALQFIENTSVGLLWFLIILVSIHFFLSEWPNIRKTLFSSVPLAYQPEAEELYYRVRDIWLSYLRGQIVLMLIVGIVFTIVWTIMGIPGALVLGMLAGLFTLVPDVGPLIAAVIAALVALLEGSTWIPLSNVWVAGILLVVYLILINLKNFFLRPIIMGRSVHMNEALVLVAILVATILWGIVGALLVVPVLASLIVIFGYLKRRVLGLPPFESDSNNQFRVPPEKLTPRRNWIKRYKISAGRKANVTLPSAGPASFESEANLNLDSDPLNNQISEKPDL